MLPNGTKVELPFYLAIALFQREIADIQLPKYMSREYFNTLKAGSDVVTMRSQSPYIYENVNRMCEFLQETNLVEDIMKIYQKVFLDRFFSLVLDHSNNSTKTEQFSQVLRKLTNLERELFESNKRQKL